MLVRERVGKHVVKKVQFGNMKESRVGKHVGKKVELGNMLVGGQSWETC